MKIRQLIILTIASLFVSLAHGQGLTIESGSHLVANGNVALVINDGNFTNNGAYNTGGTSTVYMKGNAASENSKINGTGGGGIQNLVIDKTANGIQLEKTIYCWNMIQLQSGDLDLNGNDIFLFNFAAIQNETETNRIWGNSGRIVKTFNLNAPTNVNPGNIGMHLTSTDNLGTFTIERSHQIQTINGSSAVSRQYKIDFFNTGLNIDYTLDYFDTELNGVSEGALKSWEHETDWQQRTATSIDTTLNKVQLNGRSETDTLWAFANGLLLVAPKVFLEGNYAGSGLMSDHLRAGDLLPLTEPYTSLGFTHVGGGGESVDAAVLAVTGNNAITDWLFLELRDKADSTVVLQTTAALLQKDGDIVDMDGVSPVRFSNIPADDYFLIIRHRNHFGAMSAGTIAVSTTAVSFDFTDPASNTYTNGANAQVNLSGTMALISGDSNNDGEVNAIDNNNAWIPQNGQTYIYLTSTADFNLDGTVNAVDKNNILLINNSKVEQLPGN